MSRNQDRLGLDGSTLTPEQDSVAAPAATATAQPSSNAAATQFSWSVPSEFVTLPTGGKFYPAGHPLYERESVEIRYMTAKEEDILTSRALLKEGVALERMIANLIVDKTIPIDDLLIGDKNAILVAARRTGYGSDYETMVTCPVCATPGNQSFDISDPPITDIEAELEKWSAEMTGVATFSVLLPLTNATVECRFLTSKDEQLVMKENERKIKKKLEVGATTTALRSFLVSVNGDDSPFTIESFIQALPARDARILRQAYGAIVPNINLQQLFSCETCSYEADMEVPLGSDFFWPQ